MRSENSSHIDETKIIFTTDVHGHLFPYDFITQQDASGSMARLATYLKTIRCQYGDKNILTLDNGDILQGQPSVYYYNFIDTISPHIVPLIINLLEYDAIGVGNHDVETGNLVLDRVYSQLNIPVLSANILLESSCTPKYKPYTSFRKGGHKITVLSLITEAIPAWLPKELWEGLSFSPMYTTAQKYISEIKEKEKPDFIIGLFHSGANADKKVAGYDENISLKIAHEIDGFDAILFGHDHIEFCDTIINNYGKKVWLINPANSAMKIGQITINKQNEINGELIDISTIQPDTSFINSFAKQFSNVNDFVNENIAHIDKTIDISDSYFGPSAFMTLLHRLQLDISKAQISLAAPLSFDCVINQGDISIADMFTLYKYENMLCTLRLSGQEIKDYLEMSYDLWIQTITPNQLHIINFLNANPTPQNNRLKNPSYNFDSAAGINYTVNVTKPFGDRIEISSLSDGSTFNFDTEYTVAVNSYRANGGGGLLTEGAGIAPHLLSSRIVKSTDKDLRYYMIQLLKKKKHIVAETEYNWHFVPVDIANKAINIDKEILFGSNSSKVQK